MPQIIVSGKFGSFFQNYLNYKDIEGLKVMHVDGGLRTGTKLDLEVFRDLINKQYFIFIDDSFYSSKTRDTIQTEIERLGGTLLKTFVIYDGSKDFDKKVMGLYRYYSEGL